MTDNGLFQFDDLDGVLARVADRLDDKFTGFVIAQCAGAVIGFGLTIFFKSETSKHE